MKTIYRHFKPVEREFKGVQRLLQREKRKRENAENQIEDLRKELEDKEVILPENTNNKIILKKELNNSETVYVQKPNGDLQVAFPFSYGSTLQRPLDLISDSIWIFYDKTTQALVYWIGDKWSDQ